MHFGGTGSGQGGAEPQRALLFCLFQLQSTKLSLTGPEQRKAGCLDPAL